MPNDRKAADALANRRTVASGSSAPRLFKWVSALARELGIEALGIEALGTEDPDTEELASIESDERTDPGDPTIGPTEIRSPADDAEQMAASISAETLPDYVDIPAPSLEGQLLDASASWDHDDDALAVGAGSNGKAQS